MRCARQVKAYRHREGKPDQLLGAAIISLTDLPSDGSVKVWCGHAYVSTAFQSTTACLGFKTLVCLLRACFQVNIGSSLAHAFHGTRPFARASG